MWNREDFTLIVKPVNCYKNKLGLISPTGLQFNSTILTRWVYGKVLICDIVNQLKYLGTINEVAAVARTRHKRSFISLSCGNLVLTMMAKWDSKTQFSD